MSEHQPTLGESARLGRLSERQREAWKAVEIGGLPPRDAARDLGVEGSTLRTHLNRAREKMGVE